MSLIRPSIAILSSLLLAVAAVRAQEAAAPVTIAVTGGKVLLDPMKDPEPATILVEDGKVKAVGKDVQVPEGARVVDARGRIVAPAFIDAGNLGLVDTASTRAGPAGSGDRVVDMLIPWNARSRLQLLRAGVGGVYVDLPPRGRRYKGPTGAVALVDPGAAELPVLEAAAGVTFRVGGNTRGESSVTLRNQSLRNITAAFSAAERYKKSLDKYEKDHAEYEKKLAAWKKAKAEGKKPEKKADGKKPKPAAKKPAPSGARGRTKRPADWGKWPPKKRAEWIREQMKKRASARRGSGSSSPTDVKKKDDGRPKPPAKPKRDVGSETMLRIMDDLAPLRVEAHWKEDILAVLGIAKDKKVHVTILGASEAWRCLEELSEAGASVALGPSLRLGGDKLDAHLMKPDLAARLEEEGIPFAFMTAGAQGYRLDCLPLIASLAISAGLDERAALNALTAEAARVVGMGDRLGSIEPGKDALLQVLTGRPLDPDTRVERMIVGDQVVDVPGRLP